MKGDFENVGEMEDTPTEMHQSLHPRGTLDADCLLRPCKLLAGTPETPELVGVGWNLALACVLCPCC